MATLDGRTACVARLLALVTLAVTACDRPGSDGRSHPPAIAAEPTATPAPEPTATSASEPSSAPASDAPAPSVPDKDPNVLPWPEGYVPPAVWETRQVTIDSAVETWSLRWKKPPHFNGCAPWSSCACSGVEWGLEGDLELVRERPGVPVERLDLGALREGGAQIAGFVRRPFDEGRYDAHGKILQQGVSLEDVVKRPHAEALKLRDYDHDGRATELVFEKSYFICGQTPSVLVGISKANPHLHVFGTAEEPAHPLVMSYLSAWDKILAARGPTLEVALQECGDHGGNGYYLTLRLDAAAGFHIADRGEWTCDFAFTPPRRSVRLPATPP